MGMGDELPGNIAYGSGLAAILVADGTASDRFAGALKALQGRIAATLDWATPLLPSAAPQVVAVEASGVDFDTLADRLPAIVDWATAMEAVLVVALTPDQIDAVAAVTLGGRATLLVDPGIGDCVTALAIAAERGRMPTGVFDVGRESDAARLERLTVEVARIAETLARLTHGDGEHDVTPLPIVGDRTHGYGGPPKDAAPSAAQVRRTIRGRRLRDQFFGAALFEDPGWDMLLDLYAAELETTRVSVSSLCIAAAVAPTTALRWIARMTDAGLFERRPDPHDRRRAFMALSPRASDAMHGYMVAVKRSELGVA